MTLLQKPKDRIETLSGKEVADDLRAFAKRQGVDLSLSDIRKTRRILKNTKSSLSDEVVKAREGND